MIIEIIIQIGSFAVITFGAWKYKDELHAILFKKMYMYPSDNVAIVGQQFQLEIPIIRLELEANNPMIKHMKMKGLARMK